MDTERTERETGGTFQRFDMPKSLYTRYSQLPDNPEAVTWMCETCGVVEAHEMTFHGVTRYSRRLCLCQKVAKEREAAQEQRSVWLAANSRHTYTWLGPRWSDLDLRTKTFATFDASRDPNAFEMVRDYAESVRGTLVLHGSYGSGKTHLLAALCNEIIYRPSPVTSLFTTAPNLFAAIQTRVQANESYYDIIDRAMHIPLLVIDDIDKAKPSEFRGEVYYAILDGRVKAGKPTAISTNRLDELTSFVGGAVCSRLKVGQVAVEMSGEDYREEI